MKDGVPAECANALFEDLVGQATLLCLLEREMAAVKSVSSGGTLKLVRC